MKTFNQRPFRSKWPLIFLLIFTSTIDYSLIFWLEFELGP